MNISKFDSIKISAVSASVPKDVYKIAELMKEANERTIEQFMKKTGIKQIHKARYDQTASDFSFSAAKAIEKAGKYVPSEIGILINLTQCPDYRTPSTACVLQKRLGLNKSCIAFDVNLGCSGFVYGISIAAALLQCFTTEKALVLIGDTLARGRINYEENKISSTEYLFGDASAAVLLEKCKGSTIDASLMTDGSGFKALSWPYGGWKHPIGPEEYPKDDVSVFNFAIRVIPEMINKFLSKAEATIEEYDALVLHQANMMIMKQIAKRIKMPMEKVLISLDRFGNTSGASIPVTIVDAYRDENKGKVKLLTSGFGVGLSGGVVSFEIDKADILPLDLCSSSYDDEFPKY